MPQARTAPRVWTSTRSLAERVDLETALSAAVKNTWRSELLEHFLE
jgi:hypothetical protein